jgi:hypothetical protein
VAEDFSVSVARWCEKAKGRADEAFRGIAQAALVRVQQLTPVDTGYLRANWVAMKEGDPVPKAAPRSAPGGIASTIGGAGGGIAGKAVAVRALGGALGPVGSIGGAIVGTVGGQVAEGGEINVAGALGSAAGTAVGATLGSAVPIAGTIIGGAVGGVVGGIAGEALATAVSSPDGGRGGGIASARVGDKIILLNPVAYARRIEYGFVGQDSLGRRFNQPGRGMAQQTMAEIPSIAERVLADMKGQG